MRPLGASCENTLAEPSAPTGSGSPAMILTASATPSGTHETSCCVAQRPLAACTRRSCTKPSAINCRLALVKADAPIPQRSAVRERHSLASGGSESCQVNRRQASELSRGCRMMALENAV